MPMVTPGGRFTIGEIMDMLMYLGQDLMTAAVFVVGIMLVIDGIDEHPESRHPDDRV